MKKLMVVGILAATAIAALGACGAKKKPGDKTQFSATFDGIMKNMNGNSHSLEERKKYTVGQLGEPHRSEADGTLYWYTSTEPCYYYKMSPKDGYGTTGTDNKENCAKWAAK
jgi:hypothetical protein